MRGQFFWCAYNLRGKEFREHGKHGRKYSQEIPKSRLREVGADLLGARSLVTPRFSKLTVADLVEALRADFELRGKTSAQNASHFRRVEADFGDARAVSLTAEEIDKYVSARMADKTGPKGESIPGDRQVFLGRRGPSK